MHGPVNIRLKEPLHSVQIVCSEDKRVHRCNRWVSFMRNFMSAQDGSPSTCCRLLSFDTQILSPHFQWMCNKDGWTLGIWFQKGQEFCFSAVYRSAVGSTQPRIWIDFGGLFTGNLTTHSYLILKLTVRGSVPPLLVRNLLLCFSKISKTYNFTVPGICLCGLRDTNNPSEVCFLTDVRTRDLSNT